MVYSYRYVFLPTLGISLEQINNVYKKRDRFGCKRKNILLVIRVKFDGQEASKVAERELHKTRWWAYKWLNRFDKLDKEGLKDQPRSGRPLPLIQQKKMLKIKQEICENPSCGWQVKQIIDIIYKKTEV